MLAVTIFTVDLSCNKAKPVVALTKVIGKEIKTYFKVSNRADPKLIISELNIYAAQGAHVSKYIDEVSKDIAKNESLANKAWEKFNIYYANLFLLVKGGDTPDEAIAKLSTIDSLKEYKYEPSNFELNFPVTEIFENKEISLQAKISLKDIIEEHKQIKSSEELEEVVLEIGDKATKKYSHKYDSLPETEKPPSDKPKQAPKKPTKTSPYDFKEIYLSDKKRFPGLVSVGKIEIDSDNNIHFNCSVDQKSDTYLTGVLWLFRNDQKMKIIDIENSNQANIIFNINNKETEYDVYISLNRMVLSKGNKYIDDKSNLIMPLLGVFNAHGDFLYIS